MVEKILKKIGEQYPLTEYAENDFRTFKANGMTFTTHAYHAKGFGHVSVMHANGFFGLMKMDTLIVSPEDKDLPLFSYDRIYAMGNDTLFLELYDTTLAGGQYEKLDGVNEQYASLPERIVKEGGPHWYDSIRLAQTKSKKGKKKDTPAFDEYTLAYVDAYLNTEASLCDGKAKSAKNMEYANGLLNNGGPATDVLKKSMGAEKTTALFKQVLFSERK